jgi:hypothetical protein
MKKPAKKPLQLDTTTIRALTTQELGQVVGGVIRQGNTHTCSCQTAHTGT